jgi:hypothetical protein
VASAVTDRLLPHIPLQTGEIPADSTLAQWINAAAVLEAQGLWSDAWDILFILRERQNPQSESELANRAFISSRLGRVVRMLGDLSDAERWYQDAISLTDLLSPAERWGDARPQAMLGLSILEVDRGNYPRALRYATQVNKVRQEIPIHLHIALDQILALIYRKQKRHHNAMSALWRMYDAIPEADPLHIEVLIIFAELTAELRQPLAAAHARVAALARAKTPRLAAAALAGLLTLAASLSEETAEEFSAAVAQSHWGREALATIAAESYRHRLLQATQQWLGQRELLGFSPYDEVILTGSAIRLAIALAKLERVVSKPIQSWVDQALARMDELSARHAFHERSFEAESLRTEWTHISMLDVKPGGITLPTSVEEAATPRLRASISTTIERVVRVRDRLSLDPQALLRRVTVDGYKQQ